MRYRSIEDRQIDDTNDDENVFKILLVLELLIAVKWSFIFVNKKDEAFYRKHLLESFDLMFLSTFRFTVFQILSLLLA